MEDGSSDGMHALHCITHRFDHKTWYLTFIFVSIGSSSHSMLPPLPTFFFFFKVYWLTQILSSLGLRDRLHHPIKLHEGVSNRISSKSPACISCSIDVSIIMLEIIVGSLRFRFRSWQIYPLCPLFHNYNPFGLIPWSEPSSLLLMGRYRAQWCHLSQLGSSHWYPDIVTGELLVNDFGLLIPQVRQKRLTR